MVLTLWACAPAASKPAAFNGAAFEPAVSLPAFSLTRADGSTFTTANLRGRTSIFFFGYTHCADACPLTLADFVQIRRALGSEGSKIDAYFVTLDPARDTQERLQTYMANFPGVAALHGTDAELATMQSAFNVVAEQRALGNGDYALDHTAAIYLVNSAAEIQLVYPYGTPPDDIFTDLRRLH